MVHLIDNFLTDPIKEREIALKASYETIEHNGLNYKGISFCEDEETFKRMEELAGAPFSQKKCFYRYYLKEDHQETFIHSDVLIGSLTGLLFLNTPQQCEGGTAFWKHKKYGFECNPTSLDLEKYGLPDTLETYQQIHKDGFDESLWEMTGFAPMEFNRIVIFDSARFHSRYPKVPFGSDITTARLMKVFFGKI